ncbi:alpha/beta hydrolase [Streptomyces sp. NPDC006415]|uniref:alpha/beta hydrolase n=1 Tax=Streptomyces sp. NPDC006415 TaxID=3155351 RepID=UPI0033A3FB0C
MTPPEPERGAMNAAGRRLSFLDFGGRGRPPLALHGHFGEGRTFTHLAGELGASWRIVALDQRGHGHSDRAADYSRSGYVEDAAAVLEHLGIGGAVVLGHSLGGVPHGRRARASGRLGSGLRSAGHECLAAPSQRGPLGRLAGRRLPGPAGPRQPQRGPERRAREEDGGTASSYRPRRAPGRAHRPRDRAGGIRRCGQGIPRRVVSAGPSRGNGFVSERPVG